MRFQWYDREDGGSDYKTNDTGELIAAVDKAGESYRPRAAMAVDVSNIESQTYGTLDAAKDAVDQAVNHRYYARTQPESSTKEGRE